jgi:hypothetical protein
MPRGSCKNQSFGGIWWLFIRMTRISELGTTLAVTNNRRTLRRRATRLNIPEDALLHIHRRENLKSYTLDKVQNDSFHRKNYDTSAISRFVLHQWRSPAVSACLRHTY